MEHLDSLLLLEFSRSISLSKIDRVHGMRLVDSPTI